MKNTQNLTAPITLAEYRQRAASGTLTKQDHANMIATMKALQDAMKATVAELNADMNDMSGKIHQRKFPGNEMSAKY